MRSRAKIWVGAMAALFLGVPLAEKASADTGGAVGDIITSALGLAGAIVAVATEGS